MKTFWAAVLAFYTVGLIFIFSLLGAYGWIVLLLSPLGFCVAYYIIKEREDMERRKALCKRNFDDAMEFYADALKHKEIPVIETPLLLQSREVVYLQDEVKLMEEELKTVVESDASATGAASSLAVGWLSFGSLDSELNHSVKVSNDKEMKFEENGSIYLTNKRIVFLGDLRIRDFEIEEIYSMDTGVDYISIAYKGQRNKEVFVDIKNSFLWKILLVAINSKNKYGDLPNINAKFKLDF